MSLQLGPVVASLASFSTTPDDGNAVEEDTKNVEQNVLEMLSAEEWEGVAVGFLLAKVSHQPQPALAQLLTAPPP